MVALARRKAQTAGVAARFLVGDVSDPDLADGSFDVVLSRHVVWTLPDPIVTLSRWAQLLNRDGRLVLIEGKWFDPGSRSEGEPGLPWDGGVTANELMAALSPRFGRIDHHPLSNETALWGKAVKDERYAVLAQNLHYPGSS